MKYLHTFSQYINESEPKEIPGREYLLMTSTHNLDRTRDKRSFTIPERIALDDLYKALDPDRTGKFRVKYHARYQIIPDEEDSDFPPIEIAKISESRWLIMITDKNDRDSVYETNSLASVVIYVTGKYGPLGEPIE